MTRRAALALPLGPACALSGRARTTTRPHAARGGNSPGTRSTRDNVLGEDSWISGWRRTPWLRLTLSVPSAPSQSRGPDRPSSAWRCPLLDRRRQSLLRRPVGLEEGGEAAAALERQDPRVHGRGRRCAAPGRRGCVPCAAPVTSPISSSIGSSAEKPIISRSRSSSGAVSTTERWLIIASVIGDPQVRGGSRTLTLPAIRHDHRQQRHHQRGRNLRCKPGTTLRLNDVGLLMQDRSNRVG